MEAGPSRAVPFRQSVFWRVAGVLVAVQLLAVLVAVLLSGRAVSDRAQALATEGLRLRMDALAEEVEQRVEWEDTGLSAIPAALQSDLSARFPDPTYLVLPDGDIAGVFLPGGEVTDPDIASGPRPEAIASLEDGLISIERSWAAAPVYDDAGFLAGGIVVQPTGRSLARELQPARNALVRALGAAALLVLLLALGIAAIVTWRLVRPVRSMTERVAKIGEGRYDEGTLPVEGEDEFALLAASINTMAGKVSRSIEQLRATDRVRRELVANVGHDLRTPLSAILGRIEEARRLLSEARLEESRRNLAGAEQQARYLTRLVDDLFELSVLEVPDPQLRREPIPIGELVREAVSGHAGADDTITVDVAPGIPLLHADGVRLLRVLNNLLSNAVKHTGSDGRIDVRAYADAADGDDAHVILEVTDSGSGIDPKTAETLFERYYRGTDARTRSGQGTGLGLAISRAICRAHGGDLTAENNEAGGAPFRCRLPVGRDD